MYNHQLATFEFRAIAHASELSYVCEVSSAFARYPYLIPAWETPLHEGPVRVRRTSDEAKKRLDMGAVLEVGATQTVPDDVRHLLHQLPAGAPGRVPVLREVLRAADLGREALVQRRDHAQLHRREARVRAVRLEGLELDPGHVDGDDPVHRQEVLHKAKHKGQKGQVRLRLPELGLKQLEHSVDPPQWEVFFLGRMKPHIILVQSLGCT